MVASFHPPLTDVMTEHPCNLLHMDLVGPAHVRSAGGKWYVLVAGGKLMCGCSLSRIRGRRLVLFENLF
jgi:hypothetical protein